MSLVDEYGQDFGSDIKARGRDYYRRGGVKITSSDKPQVKARGDGPSRYRVTVGWDDADDAPVFHCTCPYFQDHDAPCKHCWATVLKANEQGVLPAPPEWDDSDDEG